VVIDFVGEHGTPNQAVSMLKQGGPTCNLVGNFADLPDLMQLVTEVRVKLQTKTYPLD
jgi:hypothetical protein